MSVDASAGARYALLHTGRVEIGPFVAPGVRYTVGISEWTIGGFVHASDVVEGASMPIVHIILISISIGCEIFVMSMVGSEPVTSIRLIHINRPMVVNMVSQIYQLKVDVVIIELFVWLLA